MWHDPASNMVIYETQDARIPHHIPTAQAINGRYVAMPATLQNLQIMRLFGYPVIRPLADYDFPRHRKAVPEPFSGQVETANFLAVNPRACDLSDMGAGKTLSALWASDAVFRDYAKRGERVRAIVAAPLSTMQDVWMNAITTHFMGRRRAAILHGSEGDRLAALNQDVDWYIINHDGIKVGCKFIDAGPRRPPRIELSGFAAALQDRNDIRAAIIDEVGAFRDSTSNRSRAAKLILAGRDHLWLLTGTPTPTSPVDAFGIAKLLNNAKGKTLTGWRRETMFQLDRFKWKPKAGAHDEAMNLLSPYIRFPVDLKVSLSVQTRHAELSREQLKLMRELKREFILEFQRDRVSAVNSAALRSKLIQICCGAVYDDKHNEHLIDVAPRLSALREIIDEAGKCLVFAPFTSAVNLLKSGLKNFSTEIIIGDTPPKERTRIMQAFQMEDNPRVILANAEPISRGQTLTAACVTVWWGPIDKSETYTQANRRTFRPGQTRNCTVVNLAGSDVEKEAYRRLKEQESMQGLLLKLMEMGI